MATLLDIGAGKVVTVATFYKVSELLGVGRYSEVYRAFDTNSQTDVALKIYSGVDQVAHTIAKAEEATLTTLGKLNSEYFPKLRRTAKHRLHNQNHPVLILQLGTYFGTEAQGKVVSLKDILPESGSPFAPRPDADFWSTESLVRWITHMVQATKLLHESGIVHRDIKPANILLKRGPGQASCLPMFLDFNSAASGETVSASGTPRYLPPEVISGTRTTPDVADDLWAIATVGWELLYGLGSSPDQQIQRNDNVPKDFPENIVDVLRNALQFEPELRYPTAEAILVALQAAAATGAERAPELPVEQVAEARASMERIRLAMWQTLAPPGEILVPKDIEDAVTTVIAWLSQEDTQSLDLVSEIARLGPLAIPVCLQQGYRLPANKSAYKEVVKAVVQLAHQDHSLATKAINRSILSSNLGVRTLCLDVCEQLHFFPDVMLDSLNGDEGLLLPTERIRIADLCIRFSTKKSAVLALDKYMCREYILDQSRYHGLRATVATRMHELQLRDDAESSDKSPSQKVRRLITPLLIVQDTGCCIWEELSEFEELPAESKADVERGLVELMAEAFAATGKDALEILKTGKVPLTAGSSNRPVYRRFAAKLAMTHPPAMAWLKIQAQSDKEAKKALEAASRSTNEKNDKEASADLLLKTYLKSDDIQAFNTLRFSKDPDVLSTIDGHLQRSRSGSDTARVLKLLRGFENRQRHSVVSVTLKHWEQLSGTNFNDAVLVLSKYYVPQGLRKHVTDLLNRELSGPHASSARRGLEQMLK